MTDRWTAALVAERLAAAASTLRRSIAVGIKPTGMRTNWPSVAHTEEDRRMAYGYNEAEAVRILPSAAEISAMDAAMTWPGRYLDARGCAAAKLPQDAAWIVMERARGRSLAQIVAARGQRWGGKPLGGNSRQAVLTISGKGQEAIARGLQRDRVPLHMGEAQATDQAETLLEGRRVALPRQMDTRATVLNALPCGACACIEPARHGGWRCTKLGGEVSPDMPARHPVGAPCFEAADA